ncbi:unnamed protein product [Malus baccata var. baccata]
MADIVPASASIHPTSSQILVDLFVSKKHPSLPHGELGFLDSSGNTVYKVTHQSPKISSHKHVKEKDLKFRVKRTKNKLTRTELEMFLVGENSADPACDFKVKGFPFQKSCTIYKGNEIVAQTRDF